MKNDLISREDAINVAIDTTDDWDGGHSIERANMIVKAFKEMPSVQPKRGKWIGYTHHAYHGTDDMGEPIWRDVIVYHCSECKRRTVIKENYCPNCGADMSGGGEDAT